MGSGRKFCIPKATKNPKVGDAIIRLNCEKQIIVDSSEYEKIK